MDGFQIAESSVTHIQSSRTEGSGRHKTRWETTGSFYHVSMETKYALRLACVVLTGCIASGQVIEFESGGYKYQTLTKNGVTVMFAQLPERVREYSILQVAISNGSKMICTIKPEDFVFVRDDGSAMPAS